MGGAGIEGTRVTTEDRHDHAMSQAGECGDASAERRASPPARQSWRAWLRKGAVVLVAAFAALIVVPHAAQLTEIGDALRQTSWPWVVAAVGASSCTWQHWPSSAPS
jgi:hypothetical protein